MATNHDQGFEANRKILGFADDGPHRTPPMPRSNEKRSFDWLTWAIGFLCGITTTLAAVWNFSPH
jgi:hypothetical protein